MTINNQAKLVITAALVALLTSAGALVAKEVAKGPSPATAKATVDRTLEYVTCFGHFMPSDSTARQTNAQLPDPSDKQERATRFVLG